MPNSNDLIFLAVIYFFAYWFGVLVSKFWTWLKIIILVMLPGSFFYSLDFSAVNLPTFLVLVVPACIFAYPSVIRMVAPTSGLITPFRWIFDELNAKRYRQRREQERAHERATLESAERILRMQAEEAERQRQFEREKAEREARERAEQDRRRQQNKQQSQQDGPNAKQTKTENKDPYEVLGVNRGMSLNDIRKVYLKLMNEYAPDHVSHLSEEFQKMAHEKCVMFNLAWEQIRKNHK
jgi:DnaJ-domain-containing protein 1